MNAQFSSFTFLKCFFEIESSSSSSSSSASSSSSYHISSKDRSDWASCSNHGGEVDDGNASCSAWQGPGRRAECDDGSWHEAKVDTGHGGVRATNNTSSEDDGGGLQFWGTNHLSTSPIPSLDPVAVITSVFWYRSSRLRVCSFCCYMLSHSMVKKQGSRSTLQALVDFHTVWNGTISYLEPVPYWNWLSAAHIVHVAFCYARTLMLKQLQPKSWRQSHLPTLLQRRFKFWSQCQLPRQEFPSPSLWSKTRPAGLLLLQGQDYNAKTCSISR